MAIELLNHNKKLNDALQVLSEAAKEKKEEVQELLEDRFSDFKEFLHQAEIQKKKAMKQIRRVTEDVIEESGERVREAATHVDKTVRRNPWPYIGGAAVGALLLGYILGSSREK